MAAKRFRDTFRQFIVLLALVGLGLFAANPLLDPRLPEGHDVRFHLYRLVQLDSLVEHGVLYSRWAPDLAYGFGYPIFNYYAPAVYYVAELFHLLGLTFTAALRAVFALALVAMAVGMYAWVRDLFSSLAALVAAAAYVTAPYMMILLVYRGALAELAALALVPVILWATHRFMARRRALYAGLASLLYALLILTHNITAMLFTAVLLGYGITLVVANRRNVCQPSWDETGATLVRLGLIVGFGLGLSSFFWLPALAERDLVHIYQLHQPAAFRFDTNFAELSAIFGLPVPADPLLVYQTRPMSRVHLIALVLALVGLVGVWRLQGRRLQKIMVVSAAVGAVLSILMTLPVSEPIWRHLPLLPFIQFPGRFLGLGSFFVAMLAGVACHTPPDLLTERRALRIFVPLLMIALMLYVVPWQYMRRHPPMADLTMVDSAQFERQTGSLGTTTMGEFLPKVVHKLPEEDSLALINGGQRLDTTSLPAEANVLRADYGPLRYDVLLESPEAFTAVFHTFDFPGWQATLDGRPEPIQPTDPHGLISVAVPEGQHRLVIAFGATPIRAWATGISCISLLGLIGVILLKRSDRADIFPVAERDTVSIYVLWSVLGAVLFTLGFKLVYVDREGQQTLLRRTRFDGQSVAGADVPLSANFANQLQLVGMDAPTRMVSGKRGEITLYWSVPAPVDTEYSVGLVLVDARGVRYGSSDHQHPGGYPPTTRWRPEEYAQDPYELSVLPGTPPGTYRLQASVYPYGRPDATLDVLDAQGAPVGRAATLVPVTVSRPHQPPTRRQLAPQTAVEVPLTAELRLIGYDLPDAVQRAGDLLPLTLYWEAERSLDADLEIDFALRNAQGELIPLAKTPPVVGYPTSRWAAGDRWRGVYRLLLPPTLESGTYALMLDGPLVEAQALGTVTVDAPEHIMESPSLTHAQSATFGDLVSLVGYNLDPEGAFEAGDTLAVQLVWRVHRQTRTAYKTFVHLLDAEGRRVAGSDQVPVVWQRPTTGWIAGEYIVDRHALTIPTGLPEGEYRLQVGLYEEATSERLERPEGADTAVLNLSVEVQE